MSWPRQSLSIALFAILVPWASADTITVDTRRDISANDSFCSLREAVEYFNRGKPEAGYQGCKAPAKDDLDTIILPAAKEPYLITEGSIRVHKDLTFSGAGRIGDERTLIEVRGAHRAFLIYDSPVYRAPACASAPSGCASEGNPADPYDSSPILAPESDTGTPGDFLTDSRALTFTGLVHIPADDDPATPTVTVEDLGTSMRTTSVVRSFKTLVTLYAIPLGGERTEMVSGYAVRTAPSSTEGTWNLNALIPRDGQYSFVYTTRVDEFRTTTVVVTDKGTGTTISTNTTTAPKLPLAAASPDSLPTTVTVYSAPVRRLVTFKELEVAGCGLLSGCAANDDGMFTYLNDAAIGLVYDYVISGTAGKGGVIFGTERVVLTDVQVRGGVATIGGGLYVGMDGGVEVIDSELRENRADSGAAVYGEQNTVSLLRSLVSANIAAAGGPIVTVVSETRPAGTGLQGTNIESSTISMNDGLALSLREGASVKSATVVLNSSGGIDFNNESVRVFGSIVAGNHTNFAGDPGLPVAPFLDCINFNSVAVDPDLPSVMRSSLVIDDGGCPEDAAYGIQVISNSAGTTGQLMASHVGGGTCNSPFGLLCPLADNGGPTFSHKPRLLIAYNDVDESPLINKGPRYSGGGEGFCPSLDQRGEDRQPLPCDIGAVEMQQVPAGSKVRSGGSIFHGQVYRQSLADELADEELLEASVCPAVPPADPADVVPGSYRSDVVGCPWLQKAPVKGRVDFENFNASGRYVYTPGSNFHGFDRFEVRVMTTVSRLNENRDDQSRLVSVVVVVEPPGGFASSNVGGVTDFVRLLVLGLLGLVVHTRRRNRA